jgi:hypothetical protein
MRCVIPSTYAVEKVGRFNSVNAEQNPSAVAQYLRDALRAFE